MSIVRVFGVATVLLAGFGCSAWAQLRFNPSPPVVLHAGSGAGELTLKNGKSPLPLKLSVGPFADAITKAAILGATAALSLEAGGGKLPVRLGKDQSLRIEAQLGQMPGASQAVALIFNQGVEIGSLTAIAADAPLNLSIEGDGSADRPLSLPSDARAVVKLRNGDAEAYALRWNFQLGCIEQHGSLLLAPNGSAEIALTPADCLYTWKERVRPAARIGSLHLVLQAPAGIAEELLPQQSIPVHLSLMRAGPDRTLIDSYLYVGAALLIGGLLSMLASSLLPTLLRKTGLRSQIGDLADRTTSVSMLVDSNLRVLLRLERKKLQMLLGKARALYLTTADTLDQVTDSIGQLSKRLAVAERLDDLRRQFEAISAVAPPSVTDGLDAQLQAAANQLHAINLPDANVAMATALLDRAQGTLVALDDEKGMTQLVAMNFASLKIRVSMFPKEDFDELQKAIPGIFDILDKPFDNPANLTREMLFALDHAISSIHTAFDYAMVKDRTPLTTGSTPGEPDQSSRARLLRHQPRLFQLLGTLSWSALREARILVRQMRENIYEEDLLAEFNKKCETEIIFDTQKARPYLPVYFSIAFKNERLNRAAAIDQLVFKWTFPGHLHETGWKVCHFFPETLWNTQTLQMVHVAIRGDGDGHTGTAGQNQHALSKAVEVESQHGRDRTRAFTETLRFFIAFGVALAGLLSGALEQLSKLDLGPATIAIVALGFGADSIKNLLTQSPRKASS